MARGMIAGLRAGTPPKSTIHKLDTEFRYVSPMRIKSEGYFVSTYEMPITVRGVKVPTAFVTLPRIRCVTNEDPIW